MKTTQEITLFLRDYKALLKFRTFVKTYYPNYHMCINCGELVPDNNICAHCNIKTPLSDKIGLKVDNPNSTQNKIKKLFELIKWNQNCNGPK